MWIYHVLFLLIVFQVFFSICKFSWISKSSNFSNFFWLGISKKKKIAFFPLALKIDYKPLDINPRETAIIPMFRQPLCCCCVGHSESLREHPMTSSETFKLQKVFSSLHLKISSFFWLPSGLRLGLSSAPNKTFGFL